jgi:hypothetical protein
MLLSSLFVPAFAQAIGSIPVIGQGYVEFLKGTGLDITYEAGFIEELGAQVAADNVNLTVLAATSDGTQTVVMFTFNSADTTALNQVWQTFMDGRMTIAAVGAGAQSWTTQKDEQTGEIYGILKTRAASFFSRNLTLRAQVTGENKVWEINFPVMRLSERVLDTFKIDRDVTVGGDKVHLENIVFAPTQTVLHFTSLRPEGEAGDGKSARVDDGKPIPAGSPPELTLHDTWELRKADGTQVLNTGASYHYQDGVRTAEIDFLPTKDRNLSLYFTGYDGTTIDPILMKAEEGASGKVGDYSLEVSQVEVDEAGTSITFTWNGPGKLMKMGADLFADDGGTHQGEPVEMGEKEWTLFYKGVTAPKSLSAQVYTKDYQEELVFQLGE